MICTNFISCFNLVLAHNKLTAIWINILNNSIQWHIINCNHVCIVPGFRTVNFRILNSEGVPSEAYWVECCPRVGTSIIVSRGQTGFSILSISKAVILVIYKFDFHLHLTLGELHCSSIGFWYFSYTSCMSLSLKSWKIGVEATGVNTFAVLFILSGTTGLLTLASS